MPTRALRHKSAVALNVNTNVSTPRTQKPRGAEHPPTITWSGRRQRPQVMALTLADRETSAPAVDVRPVKMPLTSA